MHRLGYGAMRITGRGIWGEPPDRDACIDTLQRLPQLGVNFIDSSNVYAEGHSEEFISMYSPGVGKVYDYQFWWSDGWDADSARSTAYVVDALIRFFAKQVPGATISGVQRMGGGASKEQLPCQITDF